MNERVLTVIERHGQYVAGIFTADGVFATTLPHKTRKEAVRRVGGEGLPEKTTDESIRVLESCFAISEGRDTNLSDIQFDFSGLTEKQTLIVKAALTIPKGETISYGNLAKKAGLPGAARFAGNVMRNNRHCPLVPCHRVVGSKGFGGYGGQKSDISKKIELLSKEGAI
jgi:methylated-DNA-[protein]-cysteine S-methyltransferase